MPRSPPTGPYPMKIALNYGAAEPASLELTGDFLAAGCQAGPTECIGDPTAAIAAAAANPLEFPPLIKAVVPGDRIVIALDDDLPHVAQLVAGIVENLLSGETEPEQIAILRPYRPGGAAGDDPTTLLPAPWRDRIEIEVHDPTDRNHLSYVAASKEAKPVYFNRTLADADVVLPISTVRLRPLAGQSEGHTGLFPQYSDEETRNRFAAPSSSEFEVHQRRRGEEADEAAWLLGVQLGVQVVPGPAGEVLHIVAGELKVAGLEADRLSQAAWDIELPHRAPLVVAAIDGPAANHGWPQFTRALQAAARCVEDDGTIVICSQLAEPPGAALKGLVQSASPHELLAEVRRSRASDAATAALLARTLLNQRVFLLSQLPEETVEELGMGHLAGPPELARLCGQFQSGIVLASAQHLMPRVASEVMS